MEEPHDKPALAPGMVGIFVGGASRRMGTPKGLLLAPPGPGVSAGMTLLGRAAWVAESAFPEAERCLVGVRPEYRDFPLRALPDALNNSGPLGGLVALLQEAETRGLARVIAVGCDFPYVSARFLQKLAAFQPEASVVAPHLDGYYQPLVARYDTVMRAFFETALRERRLSLQRLFVELGVLALPVDSVDAQELRDWDEPGDIM